MNEFAESKIIKVYKAQGVNITATLTKDTEKCLKLMEERTKGNALEDFISYLNGMTSQLYWYGVHISNIKVKKHRRGDAVKELLRELEDPMLKVNGDAVSFLAAATKGWDNE